MNMVHHQDVRVEPAFIPLFRFDEYIPEIEIISVTEENSLLIISPVDDVVGDIRKC